MSTARSDGDGSGLLIIMIPHSVWEEDPQLIDEHTHVDSSSCGSGCTILFVNELIDTTIRGAAIVDALPAATRAEDLADAFAWFAESCTSGSAQSALDGIRNRAISIHGSTLSQESVPIPTRSINNEVAIYMMHAMYLEYEIRLTGLRSATHLMIGREGIIRSLDSTCPEQWKAHLYDGTCLSVKAANFLHVHRGDHKYRSPVSALLMWCWVMDMSFTPVSYMIQSCACYFTISALTIAASAATSGSTIVRKHGLSYES